MRGPNFLSKKFVGFILGITAATLAINYNYLVWHNVTTEASLQGHAQPTASHYSSNSSSVKLAPAAQLKQQDDAAKQGAAVPSVQVSVPLSKEEKLVTLLKYELDRAREDYLRVQPLIAEEYLSEQEGKRARDRVLKASEALKAAQWHLEQAFLVKATPSLRDRGSLEGK